MIGEKPQPRRRKARCHAFGALFLKGIYGREMFETWYKMSSMVRAGLDISPVITHRFPVAEFKTGFETMMSGQSGKVVLDWS